MTILVAALMLLAPATVGWAETAREILDRRRHLDDTTRQWTDREQRIALTISGRRGSERHRRLVVYERRLPEDERQTILFFDEPAEVRGTGLLSFSHPGRAAEQWLYLPALNRVRQISADTRSQSFVGTDLSYQDLDLIQEIPSWTEADARSSLLREDLLADVSTYVIALTPKRDDVAYERIVLWLGIDDLVGRRIEFFDTGADPVKTISQGRIEAVGVIPVPHRIEVERPRRGSRTVLVVESVRFDAGLEEDLFTTRALERGER